MIRTPILLSLSFCATAGYAAAQPVAPTTGLRAEAVLGYDSLHTSGAAGNGRSLAYALRAGYDVPVRANLTIGLEGEIGGSSSETERTDLVLSGLPLLSPSISPFPLPLPTFRPIVTTSTLGRSVAGGARVTWWAGQRIGLYVAGAYVNQRVETCVQSNGAPCSASIPPGPSLISLAPTFQATNRAGWRAGGGAQVLISRYWYGLVEYRHTWVEGGILSHQAVAGLGLRF